MTELSQRIASSYVWVFVSLLAVLSFWETFAPRRELRLSTQRRWVSHALLYFASLLPVRLLGVAPLLLAFSRSHSRYGILSRSEIPWMVRFAAAFLVIDLLRYWVHRGCHSIPWLWRIHLLHHSDRDFDLSTEFRFHPLEAAIQLTAFLAFIWIFSPPPLAVALAELLAIAVGLTSHANVNLPPRLEAALRWVVVTPGLHQIHHSIEEREQQRNLGVILIWWDRLFGTYCAQPASGYDALEFGIREIDAAKCLTPLHMVNAPFSGQN